jgi:hypothetical protein
MLCRLIVDKLRELDGHALSALVNEAKNFSKHQVPDLIFEKTSYAIDLTSASCSFTDLLPQFFCDVLSEIMQVLEKYKTNEVQEYLKFKPTYQSFNTSQQAKIFMQDIFGLIIYGDDCCNENDAKELLNKINNIVVVLNTLTIKLPSSMLDTKYKVDEVLEEFSEIKNALKGMYEQIEKQKKDLGVKKDAPSSQEEKRLPAGAIEEKPLLVFDDIVAIENQKMIIVLYEMQLSQQRMKLKTDDKVSAIVDKIRNLQDLKNILLDAKLTPVERRRKFSDLLNSTKQIFNSNQNCCFRLFKRATYDQIVMAKLAEFAPSSLKSYTVPLNPH